MPAVRMHPIQSLRSQENYSFVLNKFLLSSSDTPWFLLPTQNNKYIFLFAPLEFSSAVSLLSLDTFLPDCSILDNLIVPHTEAIP